MLARLRARPAPPAPGAPPECHGRILVAEDHAPFRQMLSRMLRTLGYDPVTVADGQEALTRAIRDPFDAVILDIVLPGLNGIDICQQLKRAPDTRLLPVVLLTAHGSRPTRLAGLEAGADDFFTKPPDLREIAVRLRVLTDLKHFTDHLEDAERLLTTLALTVEARDAYTAGHCARLARLAGSFGRALGLDATIIQHLRLGGLLHDIGKVTVPDQILNKPGALTPEEWTRIREHPLKGESLCEPLHTLEPVRILIRSHHERWDGSGYPNGLAGKQIPLAAQILGLVDVWDALLTRRSYKPPLTPDEARVILQNEGARTWWNPALLREFLRFTLAPPATEAPPPRRPLARAPALPPGPQRPPGAEDPASQDPHERPDAPPRGAPDRA